MEFSVIKNYKIKKNEDNTCQILDYQGKENNVEIPKMLDGYKVTTIALDAFCDLDFLENVSIPETITLIEDGVFAGCLNIKNISVNPNNKNYEMRDGFLIDLEKKMIIFYIYNPDSPICVIPDGIRLIGDFVFENHNYLKEIIIAESVIGIGEFTFDNCLYLDTIKLPQNLKYLGGFSKCSLLENINIPEGVSSISSYAFIGCKNLKQITIPNSVGYIGDGIFDECDNLKEIVILKDSPVFDYLNLSYPNLIKTI